MLLSTFDDRSAARLTAKLDNFGFGKRVAVAEGALPRQLCTLLRGRAWECGQAWGRAARGAQAAWERSAPYGSSAEPRAPPSSLPHRRLEPAGNRAGIGRHALWPGPEGGPEGAGPGAAGVPAVLTGTRRAQRCHVSGGGAAAARGRVWVQRRGVQASELPLPPPAQPAGSAHRFCAPCRDAHWRGRLGNTRFF